MKTLKLLIASMLLVVLVTASTSIFQNETIGTIERLDPALNALIEEGAEIEVIAKGFDWTEGPLWVEKEKMVLFSDIPQNKIYKWTEKGGLEEYLTPSGYTSDVPRGGEMGSNGLIINKDGKLVMAQHGDRRIALMDASLKKPAAKFVTISGGYNGKKLHSPNDVISNSKGEYFFTDPPYGLPPGNREARELDFQGVYKVNLAGQTILLIDSLTRPNGIAFSPDEKILYVANSDPRKARWYTYELDGDKVVSGKIFADVTANSREGGVCDGMKVDRKGNVYGTGPGGVWIYNSSGKLLGRIKVTGRPISNLTFSGDEKTVYMTSDDYLLRLKMRK